MTLKLAKERFEKAFFAKSDEYFSQKNPLNSSILYSLKAPAKRIRPLLCLGFSRGFGGDEELAHICGSSVEMVHTYSLIHDDLPAMDNDDYRRGQLTNHKVYGEAVAILAGDSLLNLAPLFLMKELSLKNVDGKKIIELSSLLLESSGHRGMVLGQALDMQNESELKMGDPNELAKLLIQIHQLKTGSLITWSCLAGLYTLHNDDKIKNNSMAVTKIGEQIGLLFQMVDDVLDVTSSLNELGKTPGKDFSAQKLTYTNLYGLEKTIDMANELIKDLRSQIKNLGSGEWNLVYEIIDTLAEKLRQR